VVGDAEFLCPIRPCRLTSNVASPRRWSPECKSRRGHLQDRRPTVKTPYLDQSKVLDYSSVMDKTELERLIADRYSSHEIARRLGYARTTVAYWLKKFGLATSPVAMSARRRQPNCPLCGKKRTDQIQTLVCWACYSKIKRVRVKQGAIAYLGGKCSRCGCHGHPDIFDIHHTSDNKEFSIANGYSRSRKALKRELAKCVLLCANCHRLTHVSEVPGALREEIDRLGPLDFSSTKPKKNKGL